jgi:serine/threonine-protein kinase RsbW
VFEPVLEATRLSVELSPDMENLERLCGTLGSFLEPLGLTGERFALCLLLREAAGNALRHGCKGQGTLRVDLEIKGRTAVLTLEHDGPGWDWRSREPSLPEPCATTGRGLFILRSYSESVTYNDRGNRMRITRTLPPRQGEDHERHRA